MTKRATTFLMANLGSAVLRAYSSWERGDYESSRLYSGECSKIIDQIVENKDSIGGMKEAKIIKSIVSELEKSDSNLNIKRGEIEAYFMPFSLRATLAGQTK